ncbi:hypothetical protein KIN20_021441 [Parelaphostrongylus tenuis]|uniref:Uncharacterized protein n=1 Tax=Parelaphostrongylus tenuis TaxID=148309 RepID=A0AAD5N585_PARTN|nr:hypothetical protein KIN20_021441 [Parelaphostrongylus tenuis]
MENECSDLIYSVLCKCDIIIKNVYKCESSPSRMCVYMGIQFFCIAAVDVDVDQYPSTIDND